MSIALNHNSLLPSERTNPSPSSSQSLQSDDSSEHHSTSNSTSSLFSSRKFLSRIIITTIAVLVFGIALVFAIQHWHHHQLNSTPQWTSRRCQVISAQTQQDPSNSSQFRVAANVTGISSSNQTVIAYYGPTSDYQLSPQQAETALEKIQSNKPTTCYLSNTSNNHVSLSKPPESAPTSPYIAWTATFIAAVMGVLLLIFLSHMFHCCFITSNTTPSPDVTAPHDAKTSLLTSRQTAFICDNYAHDLHRAEANDWVCSICLEDDPNQSVIKSVRLPCKHAYHKRCIRQWLRKGKSVCPLCNWNVKSVFEKTPPDPETHPEHVATPPVSEQQLPAHQVVDITTNMPSVPSNS